MQHKQLLKQYFNFSKTTDGWALNRKSGRMKPFKTKRVGMVEDGEMGFTIGETLHGAGLGWKKKIRDMIRSAGFTISSEIPTENKKRKKNPVYPMFILQDADAGKLEALIKGVLAMIEAAL